MAPILANGLWGTLMFPWPAGSQHGILPLTLGLLTGPRVLVWFLGRAQATSLVDRLVFGPYRVRENLCILGTLFQ